MELSICWETKKKENSQIKSLWQKFFNLVLPALPEVWVSVIFFFKWQVILIINTERKANLVTVFIAIVERLTEKIWYFHNPLRHPLVYLPVSLSVSEPIAEVSSWGLHVITIFPACAFIIPLSDYSTHTHTHMRGLILFPPQLLLVPLGSVDKIQIVCKLVWVCALCKGVSQCVGDQSKQWFSKRTY